MITLKSILDRILQTALEAPDQASTMLAQLHCQNIALVEYTAVVRDFSPEGETRTATKGTQFINTDIDPQIQVYYTLSSRYRVHPIEGHSFFLDLDDIQVKDIEEWEFKTKIDIITEEDERRSNDESPEVDSPEPREDI